MALLEEINRCSICEVPTAARTSTIPPYYCKACYDAHNKAIYENAPWARYLLNYENQRRRKRNRLLRQGIVLAMLPLKGDCLSGTSV